MADLPSPDLLMFVGRSHYDEESFISEVAQMGASKRVGRFPLETGPDSEIWFAMHGLPDKLQEMYPTASGAVFCRAFLDSFDQIVEDDEINAALKDVGAKVKTRLLSYSEVSNERERGCGFRHPGKYILTGNDVIEITFPMPISVPHFRGYRYINPDLMGQQLAAFIHDMVNFSPPTIFSICDDDQLTSDEHLQLHLIQTMKERREKNS